MQKIWTDEKLQAMRDEFLPASKTLNEAIRKAQDRWKISFHLRNFQGAFVDKFGVSASGFLAKPVYAEPTLATSSSDDVIAALVKAVRSGCNSLEQLCDKLHVWPAELRKLVDKAMSQGYSVRVIGDSLHFTGLQPRGTPTSITFPAPKKEIVFGVISDTHYGSKYCRHEEIADYVETAYKAGIRDIFHAGDFLDGHRIYPGQELELECVGFEAQAQAAIDRLPIKDGLTYHFIAGNHDLSFHKLTGQEPGEGLVAKASMAGRKDLHYLGPEQAQIYYGGNCEGEGVLIEMIHPGGGGAYAASYKLQKIVEAMQGGTKPQFLFQGHEHQFVHIVARNVHALKPCCFQSQTPFMLRKNLHPVMGGLICHAHVTDEFSVRSFNVEVVTYYGQFHKPKHA
jgi:hypothetical protein